MRSEVANTQEGFGPRKSERGQYQSQGEEMKRTWSVVVVHEDDATREQAVRFCDALIQRFWAQCEFEVSWWSYWQLEQANTAKESVAKAVQAKLMVFASRPENAIPPRVELWIEDVLRHRQEPEGSLVGLGDTETEGHVALVSKSIYLRNAAHRAGMDYLTQVPEEIGFVGPDSLDSCSERARQVTNVLDEILHKRFTPPPIG